MNFVCFRDMICQLTDGWMAVRKLLRVRLKTADCVNIPLARSNDS